MSLIPVVPSVYQSLGVLRVFHYKDEKRQRRARLKADLGENETAKKHYVNMIGSNYASERVKASISGWIKGQRKSKRLLTSGPGLL